MHHSHFLSIPRMLLPQMCLQSRGLRFTWLTCVAALIHFLLQLFDRVHSSLWTSSAARTFLFFELVNRNNTRRREASPSLLRYFSFSHLSNTPLQRAVFITILCSSIRVITAQDTSQRSLTVPLPTCLEQRKEREPWQPKLKRRSHRLWPRGQSPASLVSPNMSLYLLVPALLSLWYSRLA
jgi:hypothetical protein